MLKLYLFFYILKRIENMSTQKRIQIFVAALFMIFKK